MKPIYSLAGRFKIGKKESPPIITLDELKQMDRVAYNSIVNDDAVYESSEIEIELVRTYKVIVNKITYDDYFDDSMFAQLSSARR